MNRRGFTLLEIGIVLAAISVLTASVAVGSSAFLRSATADRTAKEMEGLLQAGRDAASRVIIPDYNGALVTYRFLSRTGPALTDAAGFSGPPGSPCYVVGSAQDTGPAGLKVRDMMSVPGTVAQPNNPYGQPYTYCLNARRLEIQTCIPQDDAQDYAVYRGMGTTCFTACPGGFLCRTTSTSVVPARSLRLQTSYGNKMFEPVAGL